MFIPMMTRSDDFGLDCAKNSIECLDGVWAGGMRLVQLNLFRRSCGGTGVNIGGRDNVIPHPLLVYCCEKSENSTTSKVLGQQRREGNCDHLDITRQLWSGLELLFS